MGVHPSESMMHIAYSPIFAKCINFPYFRKSYKFPLFSLNFRLLWLNQRFLASLYFDHDAFMHYVLLDGPAASKSPPIRHPSPAADISTVSRVTWTIHDS